MVPVLLCLVVTDGLSLPSLGYRFGFTLKTKFDEYGLGVKCCFFSCHGATLSTLRLNLIDRCWFLQTHAEISHLGLHCRELRDVLIT